MMDVTSACGDMFIFIQDPWSQNHENLTLPPKVGIFSISYFFLGDGGLRYIYIVSTQVKLELVWFQHIDDEDQGGLYSKII